MSLHTSNDIDFSTYAFPSLSLSEPTPVSKPPLTTYNAALDSACTNHIFRDRTVFHTYDVNGALPVKTANCGFLNTLAIGDVKIKLVIEGKTIFWTLKNCLHAPDVPINLISVGALQEHNMSIVFSFQHTTISSPQIILSCQDFHLKPMSSDGCLYYNLTLYYHLLHHPHQLSFSFPLPKLHLSCGTGDLGT